MALLLALAWASLALGQVATPTLMPWEGGATGNAATLVYAPSGFAGGLYGSGTTETYDNSATKIGSGDIQTRQLHARLVGQRFAAALDAHVNKLSSEQTPGAVFSFHTRDTFQRAGLAVRIFDDFSIGVGAEHNKQQSDNLVGTPPLGGGTFHVSERREATLPLVGVVLRFGSVVYLGTTIGQEQLHLEQTGIQPSPDFVTFDPKRDVLRYGLGLMWLGKDGAVRIEAAAETRDAYFQPGLFGGPDTPSKDKREAARGAVDLRWGAVMLSATTRRDNVFDDGNKAQTQDETSVGLGWVPQSGWAVTIANLRTRIDFSSIVIGHHEFDMNALALHRQF
jgi:hypothetical protein